MRTVSIARDAYVYVTDNQLVFDKGIYPGTDRQTRPVALYRVKLPGNGTRVGPQ